MPKKKIKTISPNNSIEIITRGSSIVTSVTSKEPLDRNELKYIGAESKPRTQEQMLRDIVIIFMRILKDKGYPYRPNYKIASNNRRGSISLLYKLKNEFNLHELDTYYVCAEVIHGHYIMKLRQSKGANINELIDLAFKLGSNYQKALIFLKESNTKSKASKQPRADQDVERLIYELAKNNLTAKEAFISLIGELDATEHYENEKLWMTYLDHNEKPKTMTLKTLANKLSRIRKKKI